MINRTDNTEFKNNNATVLNIALLILRVSFGIIFLYYGFKKYHSFDTLQTNFLNIGIGSKGSLMLVIFAELVGGFLVLIGGWTRLSIIPNIIILLVALFVVKMGQPFSEQAFPFACLSMSIVLLLLGGGKYSIDHLLFNRKQ